MSSTEASADQDAWPAWIEAAAPKVLYGLRLVTAVAIALFVAFALELDNPSWAGTSAGIVCQPVLGSSLRKGVFRAVGTVTGATMTVVLFGLFPQNRVGFLVGMALWAAACSFGNTLTRNFSAYSFALAGYTMAIIASDAIPNPAEAFHLSITRASEIMIGIVSATSVMALTEFGTSRAKLAAAVDAIGREVLERFTDLMREPGRYAGGGVEARRSLIGRVAGLDPVMDQAVGEDAELHHRSAILKDAVAGLYAALSGWRIAESHLVGLPAAEAGRCSRPIAARLPDAWTGRSLSDSAKRTNQEEALTEEHDRAADRARDLAAGRALAAIGPEGGVSHNLLAEAAAEVARGLAAAANGLALMRDPASAHDIPDPAGFTVADYLPAVLNAVRTFVTVCAVIAFWIVSEWPSGLSTVTFAMISVLLMAPQQEKSVQASLGFGIGTVLAACLAAIAEFALLPNHESFFALVGIMALFLVPLAALSTVPALTPYFVGATMNFVPLLGPSNLMTFDTASFYNSALAIVTGCFVASLSFVLIPPVPTEVRAERLVDLTLRDLQRIASGRRSPSARAWQNRCYARLTALPSGVDPIHGARLVTALSVGLQALRLRSLAGADAAGDHLRTALCRLAARDVDGMLAGLDEAGGGSPAGARRDLRIATAAQVIRDAVRRHRHEFERA